MHIRRLRLELLFFLFPTLLATIFYAPVLFQGQSQVYAESVSHGIPLIDILYRAIHDGGTALWTDKIYGGHPIFAEGQGGFAHPLNLLLAWLFTPIAAYNILHWLGMALTGTGVYGLCRSFHCSRSASLFAVVALVLSTLWVTGRSNLSVGATITWVPWALWSMKHWLNKTDLRSASLFGLAMCLMVLGGYPHIVHGTIIFIGLYILICLTFKSTRAHWLPTYRSRVVTGAFAAAICIGLSAVQLIPLLELIGESHRSGGVEIISMAISPAEAYFRGMLFTFDNTGSPHFPVDPATLVHFPVTGSLISCIVASTIVFSKPMPESVATLLPTVFLLLLGMGAATPLFSLIYDNGLIPGLRNFRIMFPYLFVATVGLCVICAMALDNIASRLAQWHSAGRRLSKLHVACFSLWASLWLAAIATVHTDDVSSIQYCVALLWVLGTVFLSYSGKAKWVATLTLVMICIEVALLRIELFTFRDSQLIAKPDSVLALQQDSSLGEFKVMDSSLASLYVMSPAKHPQFERGLQRMLASLTPSTTALWGISNIAGNTGLPLKRRMLIEPVIAAELEGTNSTKAGLRLIDFLAVKYIAIDTRQNGAGFVEFFRDGELSVNIMENSAARPRFQVFHDIAAVKTIEEAISTLSDLEKPVLVLETKHPAALTSPIKSDNKSALDLDVVKDGPGDFQFETSARAAAWLFIADANYPGWNAYLDGEQVPLYSAQVLGKAVFIPRGSHSLKVVFEPTSFRAGLLISSLFLLILAIIFYPRRSRNTTHGV